MKTVWPIGRCGGWGTWKRLKEMIEVRKIREVIDFREVREVI